LEGKLNRGGFTEGGKKRMWLERGETPPKEGIYCQKGNCVPRNLSRKKRRKGAGWN